MDMQCPTCGAEMVPMILSSFCPRDCDRVTQAVQGEVILTYPHIGAPDGWVTVTWLYEDGSRTGPFLRGYLEEIAARNGLDPRSMTVDDITYPDRERDGNWGNMIIGAPTRKYRLVYSMS